MGKTKLIWSGLFMSSLRPLHPQEAQHFDERYKRKQSEAQNFENQYLHLDVFLWKWYKIIASYKDFCNLQSFCLCTPSLTLTKSFFSSTYLLKFSTSKTFVTRRSVSVVKAFSFLRAGFANISPTFLISREVQTMYSKIFSIAYLRPFIRHQGKNLVLFWIWCCYQFFLDCLV